MGRLDPRTPDISLEKPIMKILVAIDGSDVSLNALRYVISHHAMLYAILEGFQKY